MKSRRRGDGPAWPANKAVLLTLVVVALPYIALSLVSLASSPQALLGLPLVAFGGSRYWSAAQRLVRFMLTGEILPADATAGIDTPMRSLTQRFATLAHHRRKAWSVRNHPAVDHDLDRWHPPHKTRGS